MATLQLHRSKQIKTIPSGFQSPKKQSQLWHIPRFTLGDRVSETCRCDDTLDFERYGKPQTYHGVVYGIMWNFDPDNGLLSKPGWSYLILWDDDLTVPSSSKLWHPSHDSELD